MTADTPQSEAVIQADIRLQCSVGPTRLFRNNVGKLEDKQGRIVAFGVCNPGGSDLIGWHSVTITPDMVGTKLAVFTAVEVKIPGKKPSKEQNLFMQAVNNAGGRAGVADSVEAAQKIISLPPEKKLL